MKASEMKIGDTFNYLTLISEPYYKNKHQYALFRCVCGKEKEIRTSNVIYPQGTKSCGCMYQKLQDSHKHNYKHGLCHDRICKIWYKMRVRCNNPKYPEFYLYGGRGIKVCEEWEKDFMAFYKWSLENGYSDELSIDRIDFNKGYSPDNCRWATNKEQCNNTRRNIFLTVNDETLTLKQWTDRLGINYEMARRRYHQGKTTKQILLMN